MQELITEYNQYFDALFREDEGIDRYGIPFATKNYKYYYDSGTGKVLRCSEQVYKLLMNLFENRGRLNGETLELDSAGLTAAVEDIKESVERENIFKAGRPDTLSCVHTEHLEEMLAQGCRQMILEVTEDCNLRCKYCIYGDDTKNFRSYSTKSMSFETAKKAIDYFISIADKDEEKTLTLSFYGGEPLMQFDLIRAASEYFKEHIPRKTGFGLTSNLTLLNEEMAAFFAENQFNINCSLDGYAEVQNENRPFISGKGSFDATMRGLELLVRAYGEQAEKRIGILTVIDKPYTEEKFRKLEDFFRGLTFLPKNTIIRTTYVSRDLMSEQTELMSNIDLIKCYAGRTRDMIDWEYDKLRENGDLKLRDFIDETLLDIHQRRLSREPFRFMSFNACCVPGTRRLFVTTDGNFKTCERIGNCPYIGNVETGLDIPAIKRYYIDEYMEKSKKNCSNCWALHLCGVCYAQCYDTDGLDMKRKKVLCEGNRQVTYHSLIQYQTLQEEQLDILEVFNSEKYRRE